MPNKRKKNKRLVGGYVDMKLHDQIKAVAKRHNITVRELLTELLEERVQRELRHAPSRNSRNFAA